MVTTEPAKTTMAKLFAHRMLCLHRAVKERLIAGLLRRRPTPSPTTAAAMAAPVVVGETTAAVVDADALLLAGKTPSAAALFPPFFLVAVEAGSFARGLLLLALYPFLCLVKLQACARAMAMVSFCGLRRDEAARIGRAVLPRYFSRSTSVSSPAPEKMTAAVSSSFPTVMVEAFLKEYLGFYAVVGREVRKAGQHYYSGLMEEDDDGDKEARFVAATKGAAEKSKSQNNNNRSLQQCHPRPMVFHDGRLAFTPTPARALAMYAYLPLAVLLAAVRMAIYTLLPRRLINPAAALAGVRVVVTGSGTTASTKTGNGGGGRLYACNHRTLLDAIAIASALNKPVSAVTYSLSRVSELLSPIPLLRLSRRREEDRARMSALLARGDDVVVCPEGTTCREPFLLRFSPLFAELADEVSPVAVDERSPVFYGTSTSPAAKCLDSVFFLMNPRPEYSVRFLEPVRTGGGRSSIEVANQVQGAIADALGFQPTALTRKDKYLLLAGNEGVVPTKA